MSRVPLAVPARTAGPAAGLRPSALHCSTCGDTHRLHLATVLTLTDLRHRVVHLAWQAGTPEVAPLVATQPGGKPVVQLPDRYRLGSWAPSSARGPRTSPTPTAATRSARTSATVRHPALAGADPVAEHVAAGPGLAGRPADRGGGAPDAPPLAELIRLALGLDLAPWSASATCGTTPVTRCWPTACAGRSR